MSEANHESDSAKSTSSGRWPERVVVMLTVAGLYALVFGPMVESLQGQWRIVQFALLMGLCLILASELTSAPLRKLTSRWGSIRTARHWRVALIASLAYLNAELFVRTLRPDTLQPVLALQVERLNPRTPFSPDAHFHHTGEGELQPQFDKLTQPHPELMRRRVLVVGDSFVMGLGVSQEERFANVLQKLVGAEAVVDHLAVTSYSPSIYRNIVVEALKRVPYSQVVICIDQTDVVDNLLYATEVSAKSEHEFDVKQMTRTREFLKDWHAGLIDDLAGWRGVVRRSSVVNLLSPVELRIPISSDERTQAYCSIAQRRAELLLKFSTDRNARETRQMEESLAQSLRHIQSVCRENRIRITFLTNPWEHQVDPDPISRFNFPGPYPMPNRLQEWLHETFGKERSIRIIDLTMRMRATQDPSALFISNPIDPHWNAQGHAFVAMTLKELLFDQANRNLPVQTGQCF